MPLLDVKRREGIGVQGRAERDVGKADHRDPSGRG
jgi:hypothetical protein